MVSHPENATVHKLLDARSHKGCIVAGSSPVLTTKIKIMYYIDNKGRLIYEMCNMKSEITGFDEDGLFHVVLLLPHEED
jgi:hypothetical protein